MAPATSVAAIALLGLLLPLLAAARRRPPGPAPAAATAAAAPAHPESLSAVLAPGEEEYLAWLADHHWPADEYLDLERDWLLEEGGPHPRDTPLCPRCRLRREDVWPCPRCGRLLHSSCGHGMRRSPLERPYRTHGAGPEAVVGEWRCTGCTELVRLDVDPDGDGPPG
ncbi:hypothetical protein [Actinomadura parmotrematis]|uniref:Uncharacterized protein n=1 Tax=Actinomadura parmotrematis TaxID=2864039 RepID=A0ABS7FYQ0_9ACTN|nr:hypothetical protein [Actinomadura parmotrematis]MBW8485579.1 hypothetical protein [Actinomadura parmotrematis]